MGEILSTKTNAGEQIGRTNPVIRSHALSYLFNINAKLFCHTGQIIHITDPGGQHAGNTQLGKFGIQNRHK